MSLKFPRGAARIVTVAAVICALAAGVSVGGPAIAAAPAQMEQSESARLSGGINNFSVTPNERSVLISAEPFCTGIYRSCNAWVEFPGYSQKNVDPRGGYAVQWPDAWEPGTTRMVSIRWYAIDVLGYGYYGSNPLTRSVTRPERFTALTATVSRVDHIGRTATVYGSATKGAQIRLLGSQVATSDGQWIATVRGLAVGRNELTFEQWVAGSYRDARTVIVDIDEPQPALTATGSFPADTSQQARITGVARRSSTVVIRSSGVEVGRVQAGSSDGAYVWDVPAPMAGGPRSYAVSQIADGTESGNVPVVLDYGAAVTITSHADQGTADPGPTTIAGRGVDGGRVTVLVNGEALPETMVDDGTWSVAGGLAPGENTIAVTQRSKGANTTTASVTVEAGETEVELTAAGRFDPDDETRPAVAFGAAPNGSTVVLRNSVGAEIGRAVASDDAYEIVIDPTKATSGVNRFSVVIDGAPGAGVQPFTLDYGGPAARVVVVEPERGGVVEPGIVEFRGTGESGARLNVRGSSSEVASTRVEDGGAWAAASAFELRAGEYDLHFDQIGKGGLRSTVRHAFTVGTTPPVVTPHAVTSPGAGEVVDSLAPDFRGTGHEGATITVRGASRVVATGTVSNGQWIAAVPEASPLVPGRYNLYVDQSIRGTVVGTIRASFTVSNEAFRMLTLSAPAQGENITVLRPTFVGTATPGAEIRVGSSRTTVATTTVEDDGTWRATADFDLERGGTYAGLEVKQTANSGKTSTLSSTFTVDRNAQ